MDCACDYYLIVVLRVSMQCCNSCLKKLRKLQTMAGVTSMELDEERNLMLVLAKMGEKVLMEMMEKIRRLGKIPEIVCIGNYYGKGSFSFKDDSASEQQGRSLHLDGERNVRTVMELGDVELLMKKDRKPRKIWEAIFTKGKKIREDIFTKRKRIREAMDAANYPVLRSSSSMKQGPSLALDRERDVVIIEGQVDSELMEKMGELIAKAFTNDHVQGSSGSMDSAAEQQGQYRRTSGPCPRHHGIQKSSSMSDVDSSYSNSPPLFSSSSSLSSPSLSLSSSPSFASEVGNVKVHPTHARGHPETSGNEKTTRASRSDFLAWFAF